MMKVKFSRYWSKFEKQDGKILIEPVIRMLGAAICKADKIDLIDSVDSVDSVDSDDSDVLESFESG